MQLPSKSEDFFSHLYNQKRPWSAIKVTDSNAVEGTHSSLARGLALRKLEIPVGDFINEATKKDLPIGANGLSLLQSNIVDEERHDLQLQYLFEDFEWVYTKGLTTDSLDKDNTTAQQFTDYVINDCDDHPLVKAAVLERSVFFVLLPLMRAYGSTSFRTVAADISNDEQIHVAVNTDIQHLLGATYSRKLNKARFDMVAWMTEDLKVDDAKGNQAFWLRQSTSLLKKSVAPGLEDTKRARVTSFFEINHLNLPTYY